MEFFRQAIANSLQCQVQSLEELAGDRKIHDDTSPPELVDFLRTTLVLSGFVSAPGNQKHTPSEDILNAISRSRFHGGPIHTILKRHDLVTTWTEALTHTVLVADPHVSYYVQLSGPSLSDRKPMLPRQNSGAVEHTTFSENAIETTGRISDATHVIINNRRDLTPWAARAELDKLRDLLLRSTDRNDLFVRHAALFGWHRGGETAVATTTTTTTTTTTAASAAAARDALVGQIFEYGHPVRRALDNLLNWSANVPFVHNRLTATAGAEVPTSSVISVAIALQNKTLPANLLHGGTSARISSFLGVFLRTLIDYGSCRSLLRTLRNIRPPKWLQTMPLDDSVELRLTLLTSLCILIVKLLVLNVHASFFVTSRRSLPKIAVYGMPDEVICQRRTCLEALVRDNLSPCRVSEQVPIGRMRPYPKSNPLKFRPVFSRLQGAPKLSQGAKIYIRALKAEAHSHLANPICPLNATLSLQQFGAIALSTTACFLKADVVDCYGSLDHESLRDLVCRIWPSERRALQFIELDFPLKKRGNQRRHRFMALLENHVLSRPLSEGRLTVLVPTGRSIRLNPAREKEHVLKIIDNTIVAVHDQPYRFVRGVPQGAQPSSFLADLYLTYSVDVLFTQSLLQPHKTSSSSPPLFAVFRTMDDYLVVTNRPDIARRVRTILNNEMLHPGVRFSEEKLAASKALNEGYRFSPRVLGDEISAADSSQRTVTYCGVEIDFSSGKFKLMAPYKHFLRDARCLGDDLYARCPQKVLSYFLTTSYWAHPLALFYSNEQNLLTLYRNLFEIAAERATRFRSYADDSSLGHGNISSFVSAHRLRFHQYALHYTFKASLGACVIADAAIDYLHSVAFRRVLLYERSRYATVIADLDQRLRNILHLKQVPHLNILRIAARPV